MSVVHVSCPIYHEVYRAKRSPTKRRMTSAKGRFFEIVDVPFYGIPYCRYKLGAGVEVVYTFGGLWFFSMACSGSFYGVCGIPHRRYARVSFVKNT